MSGCIVLRNGTQVPDTPVGWRGQLDCPSRGVGRETPAFHAPAGAAERYRGGAGPSLCATRFSDHPSLADFWLTFWLVVLTGAQKDGASDGTYDRGQIERRSSYGGAIGLKSKGQFVCTYS